MVSGNSNYSQKVSFLHSYTYDTEKPNAGYTPSKTGMVCSARVFLQWFCVGSSLCFQALTSGQMHPGVGTTLPHASRYHIPAGKLYKFLDLQRMYNN